MVTKIKQFFNDLWKGIEEAQMARAQRILADYKNFKVGDWR